MVSTSAPPVPEGYDISRPSVVQIYDYYLGGTHNFAIEAALPEIKPAAIENRAFLRCTVRWMVKQGITQSINIGSGPPTASNTHDVAQRLGPAARVVYVNIDDIAVRQARGIITALAGERGRHPRVGAGAGDDSEAP